MCSRIFSAAFALGVTGAGLADAEQETWNLCSTPKTQYVLQVPETLIHSTAPTAGCSFQTPDGEFTVEAVVQADAAEGKSLDSRMQKEIDLLAGTVKEKKKGDNWFALSGVTPDGTEYHRKLYTNGSEWVTLRITYPHAQRKKYDRWVTRMEKTFIPFAERKETSRNGDSRRACYDSKFLLAQIGRRTRPQGNPRAGILTSSAAGGMAANSIC